MNKITLLLSLLLIGTAYSQDKNKDKSGRYSAHNKGKVFVSFGGNREYFSNSDIHFKGDDYDFTVQNAQAHDKPKG